MLSVKTMRSFEWCGDGIQERLCVNPGNGAARVVCAASLNIPPEQNARWARYMDESRDARLSFKDKPNNVKYRHFVVEAEDYDKVGAVALRDALISWLETTVGERVECVIVVHENPPGRPCGRGFHAHVVMNNVDLSTNRRLSEPDELTDLSMWHELERAIKSEGTAVENLYVTEVEGPEYDDEQGAIAGAWW